MEPKITRDFRAPKIVGGSELRRLEGIARAAREWAEARRGLEIVLRDGGTFELRQKVLGEIRRTEAALLKEVR